jgi:hypothetical protein
MAKPWQVWLVLTAIFAFGGVCGGLAGYRIARHGSHHPPPPRDWVLRRIDRINREIKLTPEQKARIQPIVQRHIDELTKAWRQSMAGSRETVEKMEREIGAQLTPEQRAHLEQFMQERRERLRKMMQERALRGEPEPPPGPPPGDQPSPPPKPPEQSTGT